MAKVMVSMGHAESRKLPVLQALVYGAFFRCYSARRWH